MTKDEFLIDVSDWCNHRYLLWEALELTNDSAYPVCEFGAGQGSTPFLRKYCSENNREFVSYENEPEWAKKVGAILVNDWRSADIYKEYSVVLIDHSPGEHRHEAVAILKDKAQIIVVHDAEYIGAGNYQLEKVIPMFKYKLGFNLDGGKGAGAIALSNTINLGNVLLKNAENIILSV